MTELSPSLPVITSNVSRLNSPIKRQRLAEWIKIHDPTLRCLQKNHLRSKDTNRFKVKGWEKLFHANSNRKRAGVAVLTSDKTDSKSKKVIRDKEGILY